MTTPPFVPGSPLSHKRRRFVASLSSPPLQLRDEDDSDLEDEDPLGGLPMPSHPNHSVPVSTDSPACMQQSVDLLEAASQAVRLRIAQKEQSDKSTMASYARHVDAYTAWWATYQNSILEEYPNQVSIPAFPITAAKATMFLEYTSTRPKVSTAFPWDF